MGAVSVAVASEAARGGVEGWEAASKLAGGADGCTTLSRCSSFKTMSAAAEEDAWSLLFAVSKLFASDAPTSTSSCKLNLHQEDERQTVRERRQENRRGFSQVKHKKRIR